MPESGKYSIIMADKIKISTISKTRDLFMGLAILWVMAFHYPFLDISPFKEIESQGYIGVDIFIFLSGFGLFYSLRRNCDLKKYFRNRFNRIIPPYAVSCFVLLFYWLFQNDNNNFFIYLINIWWYVPCIIIFYILSPFIYKAVNQNLINIYIIGGGIYIILCVLYLCTFAQYLPINLTLGRFPIFIFGMTLGKFSIEDKSLKLSFLIKVFTLGVFIYIILHMFTDPIKLNGFRTMRFFSYSLILPPTIIIVSSIIPKKNNFIKRFLIYTGSISFELYLVSVLIWIVIKDYKIPYSVLSVAAYIIGSYISAIFFSKILKFK